VCLAAILRRAMLRPRQMAASTTGRRLYIGIEGPRPHSSGNEEMSRPLATSLGSRAEHASLRQWSSNRIRPDSMRVRAALARQRSPRVACRIPTRHGRRRLRLGDLRSYVRRCIRTVALRRPRRPAALYLQQRLQGAFSARSRTACPGLRSAKASTMVSPLRSPGMTAGWHQRAGERTKPLGVLASTITPQSAVGLAVLRADYGPTKRRQDHDCVGKAHAEELTDAASVLGSTSPRQPPLCLSSRSHHPAPPCGRLPRNRARNVDCSARAIGTRGRLRESDRSDQ